MPPRTQSANSFAPAVINIVDVFGGVGRRKVLIAGMTLLAFAIGMGLVTILKPVYTSAAKVLIQNLETPFDRVQPTENQRAEAIDDRIVASQISVLKSEDIGRRVIAALGLENKSEFNALINGQGTVSKLGVKLGFGTDPASKTPEQRALDRYLDKLNVFQLPESNVIGIEYTSADPKTAAAIANTLANTFVTWTREAQSRPTERARDWLSAQIDGLRKKLAASEETVEKFRAQAGLLKGATATLGEQEISELNSQISVAKGVSLEARAKADAIRNILESRGSVESATDVLSSPTVQRLKEQRTDATRRMSELSVTYLSNHPKMVAVRTEIANIDRQIRAEALKVVNSLEEQARIAKSREKSLVASLEFLKAQESTANLDDVKLKALERESSADRGLLEAMLSRYAEASARQDLSSQPGLGLVIQSASIPTTPSFPKTGPTVLLITMAGMVMGLGLAFLLELMAAATRIGDTGMAEPEHTEPIRGAVNLQHEAPRAEHQPSPAYQPPPEAMPAPEVSPLPPPSETWVPPPVQAALPHLTVWPKVVPQGDAVSLMDSPELLTAARAMARWVQEIRRDLDVRCTGLATLGGSSADAPVASLALARSVAAAGKRTVLVDLGRTPSLVASLGGVTLGPGVSDLVCGTADFTKVIARDTRSPLHILRYGLDHSPRASALLLERAENVLTALAQAYDYVLVNLGEANEETPVYLHKCQAALLLASPARQGEATSAIQTLLDTGLVSAQRVLIGQPVAQPASQPLRAVNA